MTRLLWSELELRLERAAVNKITRKEKFPTVRFLCNKECKKWCKFLFSKILNISKSLRNKHKMVTLLMEELLFKSGSNNLREKPS